MKTVAESLAFVREQGVVLASAKGAVPKLTEAILGEPIPGNWWMHPKSRKIYAVLQAVSESEEVLVCRLIDGKVTLVHRRLWPALVRIAGRFLPEQLAQVREEHMPSGRHVIREVPFPEWVTDDAAREAKAIGEQDALEALGAWLPGKTATRRTSPTR